MEPPDPRLISLIDELPRVPLIGEAFRHLGPGYPPASGEGARIQGGRWNPPDSFPVLYLALQRETVIAELYRRAEREAVPPANLLPRHLYRYQVQLHEVLDLTVQMAAETLGLSAEMIRGVDPSPSQAAGNAAHYAGFEGLRAPSATGIGEVLAVFSSRLAAGSAVLPAEFEIWDRLPPRP
ncbi:MAG: RES family NAD+ phosphorylase [Actinomycetota bacterium]